MALFQTHRDPPVLGEAICQLKGILKKGALLLRSQRWALNIFKPFKDYNTNVCNVQGKHHMSVKITNCCITIAAARSLHT